MEFSTQNTEKVIKELNLLKTFAQEGKVVAPLKDILEQLFKIAQYCMNNKDMELLEKMLGKIKEI